MGPLITDRRFDIVVHCPADTPSASINMMMRALLIDRFKLAAHVETRPLPVYSLALSRADRRLGPGLTAALPECEPTGRSNRPAHCARVSRDGGVIEFGFDDVTRFVRVLSEMQIVDRPIVDKTGLTGSFKITLSCAPLPVAAAPPWPDAVSPDDPGGAPSIFTALREQLGLKPESAPGSIDVLVIDHIELPIPD